MGATAAALLLHGPPLLVYAFAAAAATAVTLTRPTQSTLMPALARTPEELTAANVVSGWVESLSVLAAPAAAGVLMGVGGPGTAVAAMAGLVAFSALIVLPVEGPAPAPASEAPGRLTELAAGFRVLSEAPEPRLLVGLLAAQYVAVGAL